MEFTTVAVFLALTLAANDLIGNQRPSVVVADLTAPASIKIIAPPTVVSGTEKLKFFTHRYPTMVPVQIVIGDGTFVAKTPGAVHVPSLMDHMQTVVSTNMEPASGNI